ncbi:MAG: zf-TFIIB domain-containing protein [Gemmatimonadetes bacterium]|nr:zf-TFIIB domain-containing protein [Gemmatimonadota bacterium]
MHEFTHRLPHEPWSKPSRNEEEYFRRLEYETRLEAARHREEQRQAEERERTKELHKDHCPRCGSRLVHVRLRDAWADQCPSCRGIWLDRDMFELFTHRVRTPLAEWFRSTLLQHSLGELPTEKEGR